MAEPQAGLATAETAAKLIMVSTERLRQLVKMGYIPKPAQRGMYQTVAVVQGYIRFLKDDERRHSKVQAESGLKAARQQLIEIQIAERNRKLISLDESLAVTAEIVGMFRFELAGLAARITRDVELRRKIEAEVNGTLARVSARFAERSSSLQTSGEAGDTESPSES